LVFAAVSSAASGAFADYVCTAMYMPGSFGAGTQGYVYASFYTGANCTGSYVAAKYFCTEGATFSLCPSNVGYRYNLESAMELWAGFRQAALSDQTVTSPNVSCISGAGPCGGYVYFNAN
jgi:hypothetical protein